MLEGVEKCRISRFSVRALEAGGHSLESARDALTVDLARQSVEVFLDNSSLGVARLGLVRVFFFPAEAAPQALAQGGTA